MFWETLWPLVLGFGASGAVQAFVTPNQVERRLGTHGPAAVLRASGYGMASSSCSYAASAMAKTLFSKGADFTASMVFMFASTNLVVELGVVLVVLLGWRFAAAEILGGSVMILVLAILGGWVFSARLVTAARDRLNRPDTSAGSGRGATAANTEEGHPGAAKGSWSQTLRSRAGWADAAAYTMADLRMVRRELLIGYLVAGFAAVVVPNGLWNTVFLHGHGAWTSIENAVAGPVIGFLSFVCSIGNIPMAAALWKGGIGFGGVISFLFADLLVAPLVLIYRRYYGGRLTLRLVGLFWMTMSLAGLAVQAVFSLSGLTPRHRPGQVVDTVFSWNYTTYLNLVFIVLFFGLYLLYRNRERLGAGLGYALDPICGMQVRTADAPAHRRYDGRDHWFCSDRCVRRFDESHATGPGPAPRLLG